jgi:mono/diheme cytochrome c family protein
MAEPILDRGGTLAGMQRPVISLDAYICGCGSRGKPAMAAAVRRWYLDAQNGGDSRGHELRVRDGQAVARLTREENRKMTKLRINQLKKAMIVAFALVALAAGVLSPRPGGSVRAAMLDGVATFKAKCATCHGADGSGSTPVGKKMGVRDLRSSDVQKQSDAQLSGIIEKGKNKMPAFGTSLSGDQIHELVAFIRTLRK